MRVSKELRNIKIYLVVVVLTLYQLVMILLAQKI